MYLCVVANSGDVSAYVGGTSGLVDGQGTVVRFNNPKSIAISSDGMLYVADKSNHVVRKITSGGALIN